MAFSSIRLFKGPVPNTKTAIYTVQANETVTLKNIFVTNTDAEQTSNLSFYVAKSGETVDLTKAVISNLNYLAGQKENIPDLFLVLEAGDILYTEQTIANALNIFISGVIQK